MNIIVKAEVDSHGEPVSKGPFKIQRIRDPHYQQYIVKGQWSNQENTAYANFLCRFQKEIEGKPYRKIWTVFKKMSKWLKTRNMLQCKSHHQKMMEQFGSIPQIIDRFGAKFKQVHETDMIKTQHTEIMHRHIPNNLVANMPKPTNSPLEQNKKPLITIVKPPSQCSPPPPSSPQQAKIVQTMAQYYRNEINEQNNYNDYYLNMNMNMNMNIGLMMQNMYPQYGAQSQTTLNTKDIDHRSQQWMQCHGIFLKWYHKLTKLIVNADFLS